jgi:acyl-CoA reductase-like NAD-dependent aldehyde dehydrogenase
MERATVMSMDGRALIDGERVDAITGETFECRNPRDGSVLAPVAAGETRDVDRAVAAARRAFEDGRWAYRAPAERKRVLVEWARLVEEHVDELALLVTLEMGKPINDSRFIELRAVQNCLAWYGELTDKLMDELPSVERSALAMVTREPLGVVGAVVPWNFPLTIASWKLGPALAAGNSVVLKPAEQSPLSALRLAELALEAGLPEGVFNVVPGFGETAGQSLGRHDDVDVITFTGSTEVGRLFLRYASESNLKRVWLELGGKSPNIIFSDAADLDAAAEAAAFGGFFNQGEMCTAASRLLVDDHIHDTFTERLLQKARERPPGDPLDPATRTGPLVDKEQMTRVLAYVEAGRADGATLRAGGSQTRVETGGWYVEPTVFTDVGNQMRIAREEIFGPVVSLIRFSEVDEAVRIANDTNYGLAAAVWTSDLVTAHRTARAIRAGTVWVNCYEEGDMTVPFGGMKHSGFGRDKSVHAIEKFTDLKTTWIALS